MEYYRTQMEELAKKICAEMHLALYDIDEKMSNKGRIFTIYLTRIGGVTLDECARFSRKLSEVLDELDIIPDRYFMEVSSPGLERPLKLKSHYVSAINEKILVQWTDTEKRSTMGTLLEVDQDHILLDDRGTRLEIPFKSINRAKTIFLDNPQQRGERE